MRTCTYMRKKFGEPGVQQYFRTYCVGLQCPERGPNTGKFERQVNAENIIYRGALVKRSSTLSFFRR